MMTATFKQEPKTYRFYLRAEAIEDAKERRVSLWVRTKGATMLYVTGSYDGLIDDLGYAEAGCYEFVPREKYA